MKFVITAAEPRVWTVPETFNFVNGGSVSIQCHARAHPKPTFRWRHEGVDVETTDRVTSDSVAGLLTIDGALASDAGRWECIAMNDLGIGRAVATLNYIGKSADSYM
jgi:Immunoglobulin domain